jgi:hypothetical protein
VVDRKEADEILAAIDRTLANMGMTQPWEMMPWQWDQARALAAAQLPIIDEPHVMALLGGLFMGNTCACVYGDMPNMPFARRYFLGLRYTLQAVLSLLDDPPLTTGPEPTFASWDDLLVQAEQWQAEQRQHGAPE